MKTRNKTLFDFFEHQEKLLQYKDPLVKFNEYIDWELFRPVIEDALPKVDYSRGGRPPFDKVFLFKVLVLQSLYDLSDEQTEYQITDRHSFRRFLGIDYNDAIPDQNTIWMYREALTKADIIDTLFTSFNHRLQQAGLITRKGSIIDASIVAAPKQRNSRDENEQIKQGITPEEWSEKKRSHKDIDADWTKKNDQKFYGYKNHVKTNIGSKLITDFETTAASEHDGNVMEELLGDEDKQKPLYGDSAYRSNQKEQMLKENKIKSRINEKGYRNQPLTKKQIETNRKKSKVRAQVEHVFGWMHRLGGELKVRTIGLQRATAKITLLNLCYNMHRSIQIKRIRASSVSLL
jgi:IS5 family transposase